jgi:hypothetical protein
MEIPIQDYKEEDSELFDYDNFVLMKQTNETENQKNFQRKNLLIAK